MAGSNHDFIVLNKTEYDYSSYREFLSPNKECFEVDDFIYNYILDTTKNIAVYYPSPKIYAEGLNTYGTTIIEKEGAIVFHNILSGWIQIFSSINKECITLTGEFYSEYDENDNLIKEEYETKEYKTKELVKVFDMLRRMCQKVIDSEEYYLLHCGI